MWRRRISSGQRCAFVQGCRLQIGSLCDSVRSACCKSLLGRLSTGGQRGFGPARLASSRTRSWTMTVSGKSSKYEGLPFKSADSAWCAVNNATRFAELFLKPTQADTLEPIEIELVTSNSWKNWEDGQGVLVKRWLKSQSKCNLPGKNNVLLVPVFEGERAGSVRVVIAGFEPGTEVMWTFASVYSSLAAGATYVIKNLPESVPACQAELGWALGGYVFDAYKIKSASRNTNPPPRLIRLCEGEEAARVDAALEAVFMVRDMINTPAEDFGPAALADTAMVLASKFVGATCSVTVGDDLLKDDSFFPQIHAVGRAAAPDRAPRLIEITWNSHAAETVVLVGKGVCYDTGGLSIKNTSGMLTMKKDMGGAAHVLGLARMIMSTKLNVGLRVLIPTVENSISSSAYRPGDIISSRNNMTTEVTNTDAEGRLILADALVAACESKPAMVIDFATLTGAQRIALGYDVPAFWIEDDEIAADLSRASVTVNDMVWRLPLYLPYRKKLDSSIADIKNAASSGHGGAIIAALYLKEFVAEGTPWIHVDMMAFNTTARPGRPEGGEAMGMRAMYELIASKWPSMQE